MPLRSKEEGRVTVKSEKAAWRKMHLSRRVSRGGGLAERPHRQRAVDVQRPGSRKHTHVSVRLEHVRGKW